MALGAICHHHRAQPQPPNLKEKINAEALLFNLLYRGVQKCCIIFRVAIHLWVGDEEKQMSDSIHDAGFFAAIGILLAVLIIGGIAFAGFKIPVLRLPSMVSDEGTLILKVTDAPVRDLKQLNITIDSFEVHRNDTDEWISIHIEGGRVSFDLLHLKNGNITEDAAIDAVRPGNYTMIRMHIVEGLEFTNATLDDEASTVIPLNVPSEKIKIPVHFEIKAGESTTIILDITADSVHIAQNPEHNLRPVVKPIVMPPKQ